MPPLHHTASRHLRPPSIFHLPSTPRPSTTTTTNINKNNKNNKNNNSHCHPIRHQRTAMVNFNPTTDLPPGSLSGKVYVVTGGNTGLGLASVRALARAGGRVYLAARGEEKAVSAVL